MEIILAAIVIIPILIWLADTGTPGLRRRRDRIDYVPTSPSNGTLILAGVGLVALEWAGVPVLSTPLMILAPLVPWLALAGLAVVFVGIAAAGH